MEINKKIIYGIDFILVVGTLLAILYIMGYTTPLVIAPIDNLNTLNNSVLFEFEKGNLILIDDNLEFSSPEKIYAENNLVVNLVPGKYYWKIVGTRQSEIRTITINSSVDLRFKEYGEKISIVNSGSEMLNVDVYQNETLVDNFVLERNEIRETNASKIVGGVNNE